MKRRLFLVMLLACAATPAGARAAQEVPPDRVTAAELKRLRAAGPVTVLDVRGQIDRKIKGAVHVPLGDLGSRFAELPREREVVAYCA